MSVIGVDEILGADLNASGPADQDWEAVRRGWAVNVDQRPVAVVHARDAADVRTAVRRARQAGLSVAAQPNGHGATTALSGAVLLRTGALQDLSINAAKRTARVGAGVKWGQVLAATTELGLTGLAGSSPDPTVVGFSLGGGLSWFGRKYGLAANSITAIEVVDADGDHLRVTEESEPELFWALRGGGGDFGIVTAVELELFDVPHVYGGRCLWPIEVAEPVLTAFAELTATAPDELTAWAHLLRLPPIPQVPEPLRGGAFVSVDTTYLGTAADGAELLSVLDRTEAGQPAFDLRGTVPLERLGDICAEPVDPIPYVEDGALLSGFDAGAVQAVCAAAGAGVDLSLLMVQVRHLGGAFAAPSPEHGAAGTVDAPYQLFGVGITPDPASEQRCTDDLAAVATALKSYDTGRTTFNFAGGHGDLARVFAADDLERLRDIKRRRDPHGVIRSNRPVLG